MNKLRSHLITLISGATIFVAKANDNLTGINEGVSALYERFGNCEYYMSAKDTIFFCDDAHIFQLANEQPYDRRVDFGDSLYDYANLDGAGKIQAVLPDTGYDERIMFVDFVSDPSSQNKVVIELYRTEQDAMLSARQVLETNYFYNPDFIKFNKDKEWFILFSQYRNRPLWGMFEMDFERDYKVRFGASDLENVSAGYLDHLVKDFDDESQLLTYLVKDDDQTTRLKQIRIIDKY